MSAKGIILDELPPTGRKEYDWDKQAVLARNNYPKVVNAANDVAISRISSVRGYTREPFVTADGHIQVSMRNSYVDDYGRRRGDVYFRWVPNTEQDTK